MNSLKLNFAALSFLTLFLCLGSAFSVVGQTAEISPNSLKLSQSQTAGEYLGLPKPKFFLPRSHAESVDKTALPAAKQTSTTYTRPTKDERFKGYVRQMFGVSAIIGSVVSAGFAQAFDTPEEWENNPKGFARRLGSAFGKTVIEETTTYGLGEAFKLDSNFYKSGEKDFKSRISNAVLSTFTARKPNGKRVFGAPRIIGTYTANIIAAEVWYPKNYDYKDGLSSGTISLGVNVGVNLLREFFFR